MFFVGEKDLTPVPQRRGRDRRTGAYDSWGNLYEGALDPPPRIPHGEAPLRHRDLYRHDGYNRSTVGWVNTVGVPGAVAAPAVVVLDDPYQSIIRPGIATVRVHDDTVIVDENGPEVLFYERYLPNASQEVALLRKHAHLWVQTTRRITSCARTGEVLSDVQVRGLSDDETHAKLPGDLPRPVLVRFYRHSNDQAVPRVLDPTLVVDGYCGRNRRLGYSEFPTVYEVPHEGGTAKSQTNRSSRDKYPTDHPTRLDSEAAYCMARLKALELRMKQKSYMEDSVNFEPGTYDIADHEWPVLVRGDRMLRFVPYVEPERLHMDEDDGVSCPLANAVASSVILSDDLPKWGQRSMGIDEVAAAARKRKKGTSVIPERVLVDTGCGYDLIDKGTVQASNMSGKLKALESPINFSTAGGPSHADKYFPYHLPQFPERINAVVLNQTPIVVSVGLRTMTQGYSFIWRDKVCPYFIKDKKKISCVVVNNCPYIIPEPLAVPAAAAGVEDVRVLFWVYHDSDRVAPLSVPELEDRSGPSWATVVNQSTFDAYTNEVLDDVSRSPTSLEAHSPTPFGGKRDIYTIIQYLPTDLLKKRPGGSRTPPAVPGGVGSHASPHLLQDPQRRNTKIPTL